MLNGNAFSRAIAVVLPLMLGFVHQGVPDGKDKMPTEGLQLVLVLPPRALVTDAAISAELTLSNEGQGDVWINGRMLLNSAYAPAVARELWMDITGPQSRKVEFECKVRAGAALPKNYVVLHPGDKKSLKVNLADCFNLHQPGAYTLRASYQDGNQAIPPAPKGAIHYSSLVRSNSVSIEVAQAPVAAMGSPTVSTH